MKSKLLLATLAISASAHAAFWDGNSLLAALNGTDFDQYGALRYITGVIDQGMESSVICPPPNLTAGQARDMVKAFLVAAPNVRHFGANSLVIYQFMQSFPCAKKGLSL